MADIIFRYPEMQQAASDIIEIGERYKAIANDFESNFLASINGWEGDSREAVERFISGPVMEYMRDTIPQLMDALSSLLEANATQMQTVDSQIAENIPTSLG